jgi:hypothetical protein
MSDTGILVVFSVTLSVVVMLLTNVATEQHWKADALERGLAMYCPDDGRWAWNGECGK